MPIDYDAAYEQTNPEKSDDERERSARAIMAGTAANEAYWSSRGTLEALQAQADGHGVVVRNTGDENKPPAVAPSDAPAIDSTSVDVPNAEVTSGDQHLAPVPDNQTAAIAQLRQQLRDNNIDPQV